jgi:hypothetical protein
MAKRTTPKKRLKKVPKAKQPKIDWHAMLSKQTKAVLVDTLIEIIEDDRTIERQLIQKFDVKQSSDSLIEQTRQAIADATAFDSRQMLTNFDYDYGAYQTVQKNFSKMIEGGELDAAMALAIELMKSGSEQVEMSDEGDMVGDIEDCLRVVIQAVKLSDLPGKSVKAWVQDLKHAECVDFICDEDLETLAKGPS